MEESLKPVSIDAKIKYHHNKAWQIVYSKDDCLNLYFVPHVLPRGTLILESGYICDCLNEQNVVERFLGDFQWLQGQNLGHKVSPVPKRESLHVSFLPTYKRMPPKSHYLVTPVQDLLSNLVGITVTLVFVKLASPSSCGLDCHTWHNLGLRHQEECMINQSDGKKVVFVLLHVWKL